MGNETNETEERSEERYEVECESCNGRAVFAVKLFESYVGKGAPKNDSGKRTGYGRRAQQAHDNAGHWANQAPWARVRIVTVVDIGHSAGLTHDKHPTGLSRDERIAWAVCGEPGQYVPATKVQLKCADLIRNGRYATAVIFALRYRYLRPA